MAVTATRSGPAAFPLVSIVIAAHNPGAVIGECLAAIEGQNAKGLAEIVVADSSSDGTGRLVQERFPRVRLLHCAEPTSIPRLRGMGIAVARGEVIAILDPYCIVGHQWLEALLALQAAGPERIVGGAVELERADHQGLIRWAVYFCEYAAFMPPLREGAAGELTGNNIVYPRRVLGDSESLAQSGFWKAFVNWRLGAQGRELWNAPSLIVHLRKPIPFTEFLRSRYHHGRCHGALRVGAELRRERWWRVLAVPAVPSLTLWRQLHSFWPKRRRRATFVMTIPLLLLFHCSWAWGELWGYLCGPGRSCAQILY